MGDRIYLGEGVAVQRRGGTWSIDIYRNGRRVRRSLETESRVRAISMANGALQAIERAHADVESAQALIELALSSAEDVALEEAEDVEGAVDICSRETFQDVVLQLVRGLADQARRGLDVDGMIQHSVERAMGKVECPVVRIETALEEWLKVQLGAKGRSKSYVANLGSQVRMFRQWARIENMGDITRAKIEEYLTYVRTDQKQSDKSVKDKCHALYGFLKWALARKYVGENAAEGIEVARPARLLVEILPARDVERMIRQAPDRESAAVIGLAAYAGMRRAEICDLDWADVDLAGRWITIGNRDDRRTKTGVNRQTPILDQLLPILARLKRPKGGQGRVFGEWATHKDTFSEVGPLQILRHTAITSWLRSGISVGTAAEWAGNSPQVIETNYRARQCPDPIRFEFQGLSLVPHGLPDVTAGRKVRNR